MTWQQILLLVINVIGGAAVIGSYILVLRGQAGGADAFWGGVPAGIRPIYGVSMLLSALGYFAFIYFILAHLVPTETVIAGKFGYGVFFAVFLLILIASAAWMPLTNLYIAQPGSGLLIGIRTVLAVVGLASIALVLALLSVNIKTPPTAYWLAVAGSGYFAFHTAILDGTIWSILFK